MVEPEKLGNLYSVDSVVEIVRLYWSIMAHKQGFENPMNEGNLLWPKSVLSRIKKYKEDVPEEIRSKIKFIDLNELEKKCNEIIYFYLMS